MKIIFSTLVLMFIITVLFSGCSKKNEPLSVKIGNQIWMVENLNVAHYRNGDRIPEVKDPKVWTGLHTGAWCYYNNDSINGKKYGKLYNWYAVNDPRGLAPEGWHVPRVSEFEKLTSNETVESNSYALLAREEEGNNKSGFSAKLAGSCGYYGEFNRLGEKAEFWSSTQVSSDEAYSLNIVSSDSKIDIWSSHGVVGFSVRCVKD
jgi:uncharacterized protein (TIGR02145 family)